MLCKRSLAPNEKRDAFKLVDFEGGSLLGNLFAVIALDVVVNQAHKLFGDTIALQGGCELPVDINRSFGVLAGSG